MLQQNTTTKMDEIQSPQACLNENKTPIDSPTIQQQKSTSDGSNNNNDKEDTVLGEGKESVKDEFLFDGDSFFDVPDDDNEDKAKLSSEPSYSYWAMRFDEEKKAVYYYNFTTEETQWAPPEEIINWESKEVLLWDADTQWFYYYHLEDGTTRWMVEQVSDQKQQEEAYESQVNGETGDQSYYDYNDYQYTGTPSNDENVSIATTDELEESANELYPNSNSNSSYSSITNGGSNQPPPSPARIVLEEETRHVDQVLVSQTIEQEVKDESPMPEEKGAAAAEKEEEEEAKVELVNEVEKLTISASISSEEVQITLE